MNRESLQKKLSLLTRYLKLERLSLLGALFLAVGAACVIVAVAYVMYLNNPNRKYDLARPGQKDDQSLRVDDEADTTSPVGPASAQQKIEYLEKEVKALNSVSKFEAEDLSDSNIQLTPSEQPSL